MTLVRFVYDVTGRPPGPLTAVLVLWRLTYVTAGLIACCAAGLAALVATLWLLRQAALLVLLLTGGTTL